VSVPTRNRDGMGTARKGKALGWGIVAILLLAGAAVSFSRPAATPIPVADLEAASATDAGTLALVIPGKFADRRLSLQEAGTVPATVTQFGCGRRRGCSWRRVIPPTPPWPGRPRSR
jgi:hypothetical protein